MIKLISREEVFYRSSLVDHYISDMQKYWQRDLGSHAADYIGKEAIHDEDLYDHLEPFHDNRVLLDDFAVIGYVVKDKPDFVQNRSLAMIRFFEQMGVNQLYLMDELKCDWINFPYKSFEKRQAIRDIVNKPAYYEVFEMDVDELVKMLPLFYFSGRNNFGVISLLPANTDVPLAMFACDDGNFHTSFPASDRQKLMAASSGAGLVMGGLEVCRM